MIGYSNAVFQCGPGVNCNVCLNATFCQSCYNGQAVNSSGQCVNCADRITCAICDPILRTQCLTCMPFYTLDGNDLCIQIYNCTNPYCINCPNSADECLTCNPQRGGYGLFNLSC